VLADAWWRPERERAIEHFAGEAGRLLALSMEEILGIIDAFTPEILRMSEMLEADVGDPVLLGAVAEEARELLMLRNLQSLQQTQEMEQRAQRLAVKASTDPLTGAANRGHFDEAFVERMRACLRKTDILARYGGEEFALILPGTRAEGARVVARRILQAVRERPVDAGPGGLRLRVTLSLGLAVMDDPHRYESPAELLRAADRALYEAKAQGRDRLVEAD